jgi:hypothetical protein
MILTFLNKTEIKVLIDSNNIIHNKVFIKLQFISNYYNPCNLVFVSLIFTYSYCFILIFLSIK